MDKELQVYYEETFSTMATKGWSFLMEDLEKLKQELDNIRTVKDAQSLSYRQGQLDILDLILNRKKTCEEIYEQLQQEER
jgi:vacuolar-type H+-ATPase subunit I/STV1